MRKWLERMPAWGHGVLGLVCCAALVWFQAWVFGAPRAKPEPSDLWYVLCLGVVFALIYDLAVGPRRRARPDSVERIARMLWPLGVALILCGVGVGALAYCATMDDAAWDRWVEIEPESPVIYAARLGRDAGLVIWIVFVEFVAYARYYFKLRKTDATSA